MIQTPIIVALDFPAPDAALALAKQLDPKLCRLKIGKELFTRAGPAIVEQLQGLGFQIFLDLKFHDIPTTVAKACSAAAELGVWMVNVHAVGGERMLLAAAEALNKSATQRPLLIGVTVLTSMGADELPTVGIDSTVDEQVDRLSLLTEQCGLDGVVCSAREAQRLRAQRHQDFLLVTPGIRLQDNKVISDDQTRIVTPEQALANGSDYLVIGRPITQAESPAEALRSIAMAITTDHPK